jgi:hypothetical protein
MFLVCKKTRLMFWDGGATGQVTQWFRKKNSDGGVCGIPALGNLGQGIINRKPAGATE